MAGTSSGNEEAGTRPASILAPLLERWRALLVAAILASAAAVAFVLLAVPRRFEASTTLAAVSAPQLPSGLGGLAALSGLANETGFTPTPDLLSQLLQSRRVLLAVSETPAADGEATSIADRVVEGSDPPPRLIDVERAMRSLISVSVERRTGLITLSVRHRDSAVARRIADRVVDVAGTTFATLAKSQAAAQRAGQERRVERLSAALRRAEVQLIDFLAGNRTLNPYSPATAERQRIEREISVASQAYTQAVNEREVALARELAQTPVLAVVDPVPPELSPVSRNTAFFALLAAGLALFGMTTILSLREVMRRQRGRGDEASRRLVAAVASIPVVGRVAIGGSAPGEP